MDPKTTDAKPFSLKQFVLYFFKLGYSGFGGPVALVGYIHRDLVEQRKWITEEEYKEGLALAQLAPGPLAAQVGMYLAFIHYRLLGATLTILAFSIPSFVMVLLIAVAYKIYDGLPWMQAIFYGISAAIIGIIAMSAYRLTVKTIGKFNLQSFREHWPLWSLFFIAVASTLIFRNSGLLLYVSAGLIYMFLKAPPPWVKGNTLKSMLIAGIGIGSFQASVLWKIAVFFLNAGTFVFGSGLAIFPTLYSGVVQHYHWLNENQFLDAVAVAMITPGPLIMTSGFIGYLVAGFPGAFVAAFATFLPVYLITIAIAPYFKRITKNNSIKAFVSGITAAIFGSLAGSVVIIATRSIVDIPTALIAISTLVLLGSGKKIPEPFIIIAAALIGMVLKLAM